MPTSSTSLPSSPEDSAPVELVETAGAPNVRYRGRLLYSERGPALVPERAARARDPGPARLHLAASPLLWYGAAELLAGLGPGSAVLFVEAEPALAALALRRAPAGLLEDPRVAFSDSLDPDRLAELARGLGAFRTCAYLELSGGAAPRAAEYRRAAERLKALFASSWRNRASLVAMGRLWARNSFLNLATLASIAPRPLPRFASPVLLCGAGPSLERALPLIASRRDRLALVACDTALGSLAGAGLLPDLVVCLEAQAHNLPDFVPLGRAPVPLVADLSSHPASFRALSGPRHLSLVEIAPGPFQARLAASGLPALRMPPLGSVGVHALHVARRIAAGPVLATGLDFAFPAGKTHARGSPPLRAEELAASRLRRWPRQAAAPYRRGVRPAGRDAAGQPLLTDPILSSYAALFAEEARSPGPAVLDIRGGGLPIGARALGLEEADALLAGYPPLRDGGKRDGGEDLGGASAGSGALGALGAGIIDGELGRVEAVAGALRGGGGARDLARLVGEADYLTWPFPDADRLELLSQDFLNRLLVETEYWRWRLTEIRALVGAADPAGEAS